MDEALPEYCARHPQEWVHRYDASGTPWCEKCEARAALMNQGYHRQYGPARLGTISVAEGAANWRGVALGAPDPVIARMLRDLEKPLARAA